MAKEQNAKVFSCLLCSFASSHENKLILHLTARPVGSNCDTHRPLFIYRYLPGLANLH